MSSTAAVSPREHDPHNTKTLLWHPCFTRRHGADRSPEALVALSPPSCCHLFSLIRYLGGLTRGQGRPSQPVIRRFAASLIRPPNLASHIHLRGLDENVSGYTAERAEPSIVPSEPQPSSALWGPEARGGSPLILNRHRDGRQAQWYTLHVDHQVIVLREKESAGELKTGQKTHTTNQQQQQAKKQTNKKPKVERLGV